MPKLLLHLSKMPHNQVKKKYCRWPEDGKQSKCPCSWHKIDKRSAKVRPHRNVSEIKIKRVKPNCASSCQPAREIQKPCGNIQLVSTLTFFDVFYKAFSQRTNLETDWNEGRLTQHARFNVKVMCVFHCVPRSHLEVRCEVDRASI